MGIGRPTLIVHTTYFPVATRPEEVPIDPERAAARTLGLDLYDLLTRRLTDRLSWGAGVPVRIATRHDKVDLGEAEFVVVVPVLGELSQTREDVREMAIGAMRTWCKTARVLPVLMWEGWRAHENDMPVKPLLTDLAIDGEPRQRTLDEIVLALARILAGDDQRATRLFISHAKGDLNDTEHAAEKIRDHVQTTTTGAEPFFDSVSLLAGEDLDSQVDGQAEHGVFVAVRGDSYSSRSWCLRELLKAKRRKLPVLTVEVLSSGERRSSAYSGNGPTIVWQRGNTAAAAARVVTLAMVECVRSLLFVAEAKRVVSAALPGESVVEMSRSPELLDVPALRAGADGVVIVLHPDPELSVHERGLLQEADKRLRTVTPTTAFAGAIGRAIRAPLDGWQVGLSLSDNPDLDGPDGVHDAHVHDATVFLARSLLGAGAAIAYGGDFRDSGYTELLAQLVSAYNQTACKPADLLHSYLGAPLKRPGSWKYAHTGHHLGRFGSSQAEAILVPPPDGAWPPPHRAALYFSDMRRVMAKHTKARVVLFGATVPNGHDPKGYGGRYPGVVEEAWRTLQADCPLYVAGGFGGAAALVADLLERADGYPRELDEARRNGSPAWDALVAALDADPDVSRLGLPRTQNDLADAIRALGRPHLKDDEASRRWNGLTVDENRTLFRTRDPLTLAALVLKGLLGVAAREARGKLRIELVEGDVTGATDLDVLVFPTFTDLDPDGAGAALDRVSGNAATRAHRARGPVPPATKAVGADFLYAADLGDMNLVLKDPAGRVQVAAREAAAMARRYGFARIGLVTFLGNVAEHVGDVVAAMLAGLRGAPDHAQLVWFERDPARAAMLASVLGQAAGVELTRVVAESVAAPEPPRGKPRTIVAIRQDEREMDVTVLVPQANGLAPNIRSQLDDTERNRLAGEVRDATPSEAELTTRGTRIAQLLFGEGATGVLEAVGDSELVILHDGVGSGLPYEALGWGEGEHRVTPATRGGIVRHLLASVGADRGLPGPTHTGKLGVLLVINPRGDLAEAEAEGDAVLLQLERNPRVTVTTLRRAGATVGAVLERLADPSIDVIHYCGHAFYRGPGPDLSGLNCADGELTVGALQKLSRAPRLAVFNACQAGRVRGDLAARAPQTFAEFFLRAGVDVYLGTFWLVSDKSAALFAAQLYEQLGRGLELGEAVVHARRVLQKAGLKDWANYVLYGRAGFRLVRGTGTSDRQSTEPPAAWGRAEGKTIVGCWSFVPADAPATLAVTVTERTGDAERPVSTSGPIRVDRRDGWHAGAAIVQWVATVSLQASADRRAFRLRASAGAPIDIGPASVAGSDTRALPQPIDELLDLRAILDQQPDGGRAILARLQPSADPDRLRADIDNALDTRAVWPFEAFTTVKVDDATLAAFAAAHPLAAIDRSTAADQHFQTKEDWARYISASGALWFVIGGEVERPMSAHMANPADQLTHDLRDDELAGGSISVALFADNGNGLHASRAIAKQIVASRLPYALHLGDVYYGGTQQEFRDHFEAPLEEMFDRTELFMITGNHEMFARGEWFKDMIRRKAIDHRQRQRQQGETFRLRGPGFQIIGLDTMFVGWNAGRMRLHDHADDGLLRLLDRWLSERPDDLTVLLTTNEAWNLGSKELTPLFRSLRKTIAGRVDLWFWGNVHYAALYEPWAFVDAGSPTRRMITSCIGHGGYPFYTQSRVGPLPDGLACRWLETKSRFWPEVGVRPDVGLNGWCRMKLTRANDRWSVGLTYVDWVGRDRLHAKLVREDGRSVRFEAVEQSELAAVGAEPTWYVVEPGAAK